MIRESDRIKSKLMALHLRLAELRSEAERTRIHILQLEAERDDARLASLFGEALEGRGQLEPQLEAARKDLDRQQELIRRVRTTHAETQVRYSVARRQEQAQGESPA
jgi:chromosome segregation ATPase